MTLAAGRGALESRSTVPPDARKRVHASQALRNGSTPLCITPQISVSHTSREEARSAIEEIMAMAGRAAEGEVMRHAYRLGGKRASTARGACPKRYLKPRPCCRARCGCQRHPRAQGERHRTTAPVRAERRSRTRGRAA